VAQEKWEYATVTLSYSEHALFVSISNKESEKIEFPKSEVKSVYDSKPVLDYVKGMTDKGWEIVSAPIPTVFILKRRIN